MNSKYAVAIALAAIFSAAVAVPIQAFAAEVQAEIVPGASTKTDDAYSPNPIEVSVGDTVIWTNKDGALHTVTSGTSPEPDGIFGMRDATNPVLVPPSRTFSFTFTEAGEYPYFCTLHPAMNGLVKVSEAGGPAMQEITATLDGNSYKVTAKSSAVQVSSVTIEPNTSVEVTVSGTGEVELTLPKAMIDGINKIEAGDQEIAFQSVGSTDSDSTIKFTVPSGVSEVEIYGAMVVPEFGVIAALILAASLVAVISFARFKGTSLGFGRF